MSAEVPVAEVQFLSLLERFPLEIAEVSKACLEKLRQTIPCTHQLVYDYSKSLVVAFGLSERGNEAIVALAIYPEKMLLYLDRTLPDPKRLLKGTGKQVRSVAIKSPLDLENPDILSLIEAAMAKAQVLGRQFATFTLVVKGKS